MRLNKTETILEAYRHIHQAIERRQYANMFCLLRIIERVSGEKITSKSIPDNPLGLKSIECWERACSKVKKMYFNSRTRARESNILFKLDYEKDWVQMEWPEKCPILGIPLNYGYSLKRDDYTPSLDRLDNKKGYVPGNISIISWRANDVKSNATAFEIKSISQFMELYS